MIYFTRFGGWELARLPMPSAAEKLKAIAAAPKTDQVPEPLHRANQMYVEKFLLEYVRTRPKSSCGSAGEWKTSPMLATASH